MTRAADLAKLIAGGGTITVADNSTNITLKSTDDDANGGPVFDLTRDSASPADNDAMGSIRFRADDDGGNEQQFVDITAVATDVTNGNEDAKLTIRTIKAGTLTDTLVLESGNTTVSGNATVSGSATVSGTLEKTVADTSTNGGIAVNNGSYDAVAVGTGGYSINGGTATDGGIRAYNNLLFASGSSSTERMRIDSSGNLFVGKTSSGSANVGFEYNNAGQLAVTRSGDTVALLNRTSSDGATLDFRKDNSLVGSIGVSIGIVIGTNDTGLGFQTSSGDAIIPQQVDTMNGRDDAIDLGNGSFRFDDIFATNTSITTSDQNEKQDIASITTKELNVAKKLSALFKTFRWKSKVTEKGDKARTHTGIIAQEVQSAFSAEGLDASNYGLFTSDTWWYKETEIDAVEADEEKGIKAKDAYTKLETFHSESDAPSDAIKKTRLGVRYPELFSFIFSSIEARLTALESK